MIEQVKKVLERNPDVITSATSAKWEHVSKTELEAVRKIEKLSFLTVEHESDYSIVVF